MPIQISDHNNVRTITIDRATKANALLATDIPQMRDAVVDAPDDCRVLLFHGAGGRAFSAGMDLDTFLDVTEARARTIISNIGDLLRAVRQAPQLSIVALEGACIGAAFELALAADLRVSHREAKIGLPEVKLGIPSVVDAALLHHYVGLAAAKELLLTGDMKTLEDMPQRALANKLVDRPDVLSVAQQWADDLSELPPLAVVEQRRLIDEWLNVSLDNAVTQSINTFSRMFRSPETTAAVARYAANR